jgi:quercetin dioxygenase-like cupin family protein
MELDCRIFEVAQPAGSIVTYHTHEETESVIVLNGVMQFNVEEELVLVNSGEMITIRAKAIHAAAPLDNKPAKLLIAFGSLTGITGRKVDWDEEKGEDDLFA